LNTKDLILNIKKSKVVGAGLDVLEEENSNFELNQNSKDLNFLRSCDKVILTPHVAGLTYESDKKISEILFKKIIKILKQN
jgi:D-3-phosphoglycerate dehydrogenase